MRHARAARLTLIAAIACSAATVCATETTGGNGVAEEGRSEASSPVTCGDADLSALAKRVYVSPQGVDSASCGATPTPPGSTCKTIHQGISNCTGSDSGVLVRWGLYPLSTTIELVDGVSLYGSCRFDDSTKLPYRSMLKAPADGKPGISATDIDTATMVYGLVVLGSHATTPGQASIAMTVSASKGLTISHTVLSAGKGGDGATPVPRRPAQKGGDGGPGDWQQFGFKNAGGSSGPSCDATSAGDGGAGADFRLNRSTGCFITCKCTQRQGASGATGQSSGNVAGGVGGHHGGNGRLCGKITGIAGPGGKGKGGSPGACGTQGGSASTNAWGRFSDSRWVPALGGSGGIGDVGSGGGGGGAGGVCTHIDGDTLDYIGLPGGGVGGGGCGGEGGRGGQQGGASIPLVLNNASVTFEQHSIIPGPGGRGGEGGQGGKGGLGGESGPGAGPNDLQVPFKACLFWNSHDTGYGGAGGNGGNGGQGGAGAGGAGGNGGPSIGIALVAGSPSPKSEAGIYGQQRGLPGSKGTGGRNDAKGCRGEDGADGIAGGHAFWHSF